MRLPSSPGYGGKSRPSASRPSLTQWIMRAIGMPCSEVGKLQLSHVVCVSLRQRFLVHEGAPLPVVKVALLPRQPIRIAFDEAALEKPPRCARGKDEQPRELELLRPLFDLVQESLAISSAPEIGMHGEGSQLSGALLGKCVERCAADDRAVVLRDGEALDLHFEPFARAAHE